MDKPVEATPKYLTTIKKNYTVSVGAEIRDTYRTSGYGSILIILSLQQKKNCVTHLRRIMHIQNIQADNLRFQIKIFQEIRQI